ncbi:MAG TPA: malto-oligosyltrehalose synthase [Solirubrobacterales bacterium]|nr:malto-oligosyltrehalose synthase [Solirubrobacterales bacterium]
MSDAKASAERELRATYRLQLGPNLNFEHARQLVPYLKELGVSHVYLSPSFQARPGSTHGYDVIDPTKVSDALGGEEGLRALAEAGLGVILDVVPNHMAAVGENRYWADEELRRKFFDLDEVTGRWRRFFDIDELAGVRQEDPEVFAETHKLALRLVAEGVVDGLRVDHPDGLADPAGYLARLRDGGAGRVWVEKILEAEEELRDWPVSGTVGYEFLNDAAALFVDPAGEEPLTDLYRELTGERRPFREVADEAKLEQATGTFQPEVERLRRLDDVPNLERALASLPIYRTYVEPPGGVRTFPSSVRESANARAGKVAVADRGDHPSGAGAIDPADRVALDTAQRRGMSVEVAARLLLEAEAPPEFVTRFQQTTPAITAKGVEDTAFYRDVRLLALNEVGGNPGRFNLSVADFHARCAERARRFPQNLLITQTHDTKRSGDSRARIGVLAGIADEWRAEVSRWFELAAPLRTEVGGRAAPDPTEEYLIYQTLVGVWPASPERLEQYIQKALREAKRNTNWVEPNEEWEGAALAFCRALYEPGELHDAIDAFVTRVAPLGERAAVGQLLLKLTTPGIPDVYQGDELWALSMVDPDNRRPVDFAERRTALAALDSGAPVDRTNIKMHLIRRALSLRARRPGPFVGAYRPLDADAPLCGFTRGDDEILAIAAVREDATGATFHLPAGATGEWRDVLGGSRPDDARVPTLDSEVPFDQVALPDWPVALLERQP